MQIVMNHAVVFFPLSFFIKCKKENIQVQNYRSPWKGILHTNIPMAIQGFFFSALLIHQEGGNYFLVRFCFDVCY